MWWLILVAVVIAAFAIPRFGKALLKAALVAVVLGGGALYEINRRAEAEAKAARKRIPFHQVEMVDLRLKPGYSHGSYSLIGRIRNQSADYDLTGATLQLTMRDCLGACETVGEDDVDIWLRIPPGQARDIDEYVSFAGLREPRGKLEWEYKLVEVKGQ